MEKAFNDTQASLCSNGLALLSVADSPNGCIIANLQVTPLSFFFGLKKKESGWPEASEKILDIFSFWRGLAEFPLQILRRA
jgi:hypothetical protein